MEVKIMPIIHNAQVIRATKNNREMDEVVKEPQCPAEL
jgi:hypothetical protein